MEGNGLSQHETVCAQEPDLEGAFDMLFTRGSVLAIFMRSGLEVPRHFAEDAPLSNVPKSRLPALV